MFWEYLSIAGAFSSFSFTPASLFRTTLALLLPLALVGTGYAIKGVWGALAVLLILTLLFLYATDNWWIFQNFGIPIR